MCKSRLTLNRSTGFRGVVRSKEDENSPPSVSLGCLRYHHHAMARYFGGKLSGDLPEILVCPQIPHFSRHLLRISDFGPRHGDLLALGPTIEQHDRASTVL